MADDIVEQSESNQDVTLSSTVQSPENRALIELLSTPSRKKPEQIMSYSGRAIHTPEPDMTMRQSYENDRQNYAYAQWIKEEGEKQFRLYQEVTRRDHDRDQPKPSSAGQCSQPYDLHTQANTSIVPEPKPDVQQSTFYRNLAQAPVLVAPSSNSSPGYSAGPHQVPPQKPTLLQKFQGYPPDGVLRGYPPDGSLSKSPDPRDLRQAHHQAAQQASHRLGAQLATRALYQVINQPPPPATQPPTQTRQVIAELRPRHQVTPSKLRYANAIPPTPTTDARAKILQILEQDKLRRKPWVPTVRPAPSVGDNTKRDLTPSAFSQQSPSKRICLTKPTVEVVVGQPFATTKQTTSELAPPSSVPSESSPAILVNQKSHVEKEQQSYGNQEDANSGHSDAATPSTVGSDHEDTPMQLPPTADSPSLSDIIRSETPSEASEESDEEYSPGRRSQQQSTIQQVSQGR
ncbi:hypothetical protein LTR10_016837 [Elasticomyces elasticus]|uniref:Uncharacterized protein n=1 Tax=Exophiala sideris TaxID=1016849 RepID=A0ABR0JKX7_9EURO|nr:hypothetical protein LTR10_016837 [Elasticomyces elasticus]KAK5035393.1 hypothetical protein LTS07_002830 [Exophiala sideris]KAK5039256.1 hypothetical protein LTR13_003512 [Exophiala sideris]KAK5066317.1 hypothetical protein LTR69_002836 [Exophiala sideris]KAK5186994.1 hypothetical protein LTR44_001001 [Eurotiomycetes sp. CCFEE 6388]